MGLTYHPNAESLVKVADIINQQAPLYPSTENFFDDAMLSRLKRGTYLINTVRGKLVDRDAVVRALESGQLAGYGGRCVVSAAGADRPPLANHAPNGMTPHISGTSLSAQAWYAAGTLDILQSYFEGKLILDEYLIVDSNVLAGTGAQCYKLT